MIYTHCQLHFFSKVLIFIYKSCKYHDSMRSLYQTPHFERGPQSHLLILSKLQLKILNSYNTHTSHSNQTTSILKCFIKKKLESLKLYQHDQKSQLYTFMSESLIFQFCFVNTFLINLY